MTNDDRPRTFPEGTNPGDQRRPLGRCEVTITIDPGGGKPAWRSTRVGHALEVREDGTVLVQLDAETAPRAVPLHDVTAWD